MTSWENLDRLAAHGVLAELAAEPFDLTVAGAVTAERISDYRCRAAGFDLLYGMQRFDGPVLDALQQLADQSGAVDKFLLMKRGEVINRIDGYDSESRQVLHTACRDLFAGEPYSRAATDQAKGQLAKLRLFLEELDDGRLTNSRGESFTDMIQIGIGGSDLGPRAFSLALERYCLPGRHLHFISNVDPDDAAAVLRRVDLSRTLVNVVSKSGTTLETLTNEELVKSAYVKAGLVPEQHFVAVTGESGPMDNPGRYLRSFYMYDYIGGRYSVTSMVGCATLGFGLGYEALLEILAGANEMDRVAEERDIRRNPPLLMALAGIWNRNYLGCENLAILPYSQALVRFVAHLQQCDMESNGKSVSRSGELLPYGTGPIVWGEPGTNGQHAFYQLIHQGTTTVPCEFIGFRQSQYGEDLSVMQTTSQEKLLANLMAQSLALATGRQSKNPNRCFAGNRPSIVLIGERLTPHSMGALMALYEAKIVFQGFIWNVNSFDQEGVQLGKVLANRFLGHFSGRRQPGAIDEKAHPEGWAMLRAASLIV